MIREIYIWLSNILKGGNYMRKYDRSCQFYEIHNFVKKNVTMRISPGEPSSKSYIKISLSWHVLFSYQIHCINHVKIVKNNNTISMHLYWVYQYLLINKRVGLWTCKYQLPITVDDSITFSLMGTHYTKRSNPFWSITGIL